jgi:outer membrane protein assembly factor BamB
MRGGSERASLLLAYATRAVADGRNVYILDSGRGEVVALRASDGTLAWRRGGDRGGSSHVGPRAADSPLAPGAIAALPDGGVAVADNAHHAIALLDAAGRRSGGQPLPDTLAPVRALCALSSRHFVAVTADTLRALVELRDDAPPRRIPLPWADLAARNFLVSQAWLAGSADDGGGGRHGRCAVALVLGRGFALYDGARFTPPARYVEWFELPGITRTRRTDGPRTVVSERLSNDRTAARDIGLAGDRLVVSFGGESALRARLLDVYDASSGAYTGTVTVPHRVAGIAAHGRNLYLLFQREGRPAVTALTLR